MRSGLAVAGTGGTIIRFRYSITVSEKVVDRTYDYSGMFNTGVGIFFVKGNIRSNIGQSIRVSRWNVEPVQDSPLISFLMEWPHGSIITDLKTYQSHR